MGDEIFPLKSWLLRPYRGKTQLKNNTSISRDIQEAIELLRIPLGFDKASVENTEKYVLACLLLHYYLRQTNDALYTPAAFNDSESIDGGLIPGL